MLPYSLRHGARRFQCIHLPHRKNLQPAPSYQSPSRFGSTTAFQNTGPDDARTIERLGRFSKKLKSLGSRVDKNADDTSQEHLAKDSYGEGNAPSSATHTQGAVGTAATSDFALRSNLEVRDQEQIQRERQVLEALHDEDPHRLLDALAQASKYFRYFRDLPTTTLSEIICVLQPSEFIDREKAIYQELHPDHVIALGHGTQQLASLFENYANSMHRLMSYWRASGKKFGLKEYKALLNVARAVGNGSVADSIWNELCRDNIPLDTEVVNLFMEARCWSGAYSPGYGHTLRVIKTNQDIRSQPSTEENLRAPGFDGFNVGAFGIRAEMTKAFDELMSQGLIPDTETFMNLMVAMGREGDLTGVKSILQTVWAVDVDKVIGAQGDLPKRSTTVSPASPLFPSEKLLYIIAHIFGSNNDVSTALRVVDYVAYKYDLPVNLKTWQELVSWTYVLSAPRSQGPEEKKVILRTGQLPTTAFSDIWKIMRSPPYNVQPTMMMHFQRVSNLRKRAFLQPMLNAMREMHGIHRVQIQRYKQSILDHIRSALRGPLNPLKKPRFSKDQQHAALKRSADLRLERLAEFRDFTCMQRALGYLLAVNRWTSRHGAHFYNVLWERIGVHNAIAEFGCYMDRHGFRYNIRTGQVHIQPIKVTMAVDRKGTDWPGVLAVANTGLYHVTGSRYQRYGSLGNMVWADVVFEDDEEDFGDAIGSSWPTSATEDEKWLIDNSSSPLESLADASDRAGMEQNEGWMGEDTEPMNLLPPIRS